MDNVSFSRPFKFVYKSGDSDRTYKFAYDLRKEIYPEKIENLYFIDNRTISLEIDKVTYFKDYEHIDVLKIYDLISNNTPKVLTEKLAAFGVTYHYIKGLVDKVDYFLKSTDKSLLDSTINLLLSNTKRDNLEGINDTTTYILEVLKKYPEITFNTTELLENKRFMGYISGNIGLKIYKTQDLISEISNFIADRGINSIYINNTDFKLNIQKTSELTILKIIDGFIKNRLIANVTDDVASYRYVDKGLIRDELPIILDKLTYLIADLAPDVMARNDSKSKDIVTYDLDSRFVNPDKRGTCTNKTQHFIRDFREIFEGFYDIFSDRYNIKDTLKDDIQAYVDKDNRDIDVYNLVKKLDKKPIKNIYIDLINSYLTSHIYKIISSDSEDIGALPDYDKDIFLEVITDLMTKGVYKDTDIGADKMLLKSSIGEYDDTGLVIDQIEKYLEKFIKNITSSLENELEKDAKDTLLVFENLMLDKKLQELVVHEIKKLAKESKSTTPGDISILATSGKNRYVSYTKDTILLAKQKEIDIEDEKQLKLWKRFWFLYAGKEIDRKILPYYDFPYEDEPITFEGFNDLMPENWQVTYPKTLWQGVYEYPIDEGKDVGIKEIPLAINIMIDMINILILMWGKHYSAFWGWTGTQAVLGLCSNTYEWLRLETSIATQEAKGVKDHYDRCFRWLRWEAEKVALLARNDMELRGNFWAEILLNEMINYMLDHHFEIMPLFIDVTKMDKWRQSFDRDLQKDIEYVLDKVKGIRHKLIEGKEQKTNG